MNLTGRNIEAKKTSFFIKDILGESNKDFESKDNEVSIEKDNPESFCKQSHKMDFARKYKEHCHGNKLHFNDEQYTELGNRKLLNNYEKEKRYIISTEYYPKINTDQQAYVDPILMTPSPDSDFDLHENFKSSPKTFPSDPKKINPEILMDFPENPMYKKYPQDYQDLIIQSHNQSIANLRYLCSLQVGFNAKISPFLFGNYGTKTHANPIEPYPNQNYLAPENQYESRLSQWPDMPELSRNLNEDRHAIYDNTPSPSPNLLPPNSPTISSPHLASPECRHFPAYLRTLSDTCKDSQENSPTRKPKKCRRSRTVFTEMQMIGLEKRFENQQYLSTPNRVELADVLGLTQLQVKTWYQNRRMKWKKQVLQCGGTEAPTKPKGRPRKIRSEDKPSIL